MSDVDRLLIETSLSGAAVVAEDGRVLYANPRMTEILSTTDFNIQEVSAQKAPWRGLVCPTRANGSTVEIEMSVSKSELDGRSVFFVSAIERDDARYRQLFLHLPVAAWESDWSGMMARLRSAGIDSFESLIAIGSNLPLFAEAAAQKKIVAANAAALELMGVKTEEQLTEWHRTAFPQQAVQRLASGIAPLLFRDQRSVTIEMQLRRLDGETIDALMRFARADNWEQDRTVFCIALDVSEAKRAERALLEAKAYAESLIENANVLIVELDLNGHATLLNRMGEEITGYTRTELRYRNWFETLAPASRRSRIDPFLQALREGRMPLSDEAPLVTRDGRERLIAWRNTDIRNRAGELVGIISFGVDVTEHRQAEAEQRRLQEAMVRAAEEWRLTFDTVNTPILIIDEDGNVARLNRAARHLADRQFSELVGFPIADIGDQEPWRTIAEMMRSFAAEGQGATGEARDPSGRAWDIALMRFSTRDALAFHFIVVLWEITSIVRLQESLRRSETLSAMGNLVAGVAHEVRNPLFGISATLDAFHKELSQPGYEDFGATLRHEVTRLIVLMQELLEYGKPSALQISTGSLHDVVESAIRRTSLPRSDVTVENAVPEDLPPLRMDHGRLRRVFENLIDNALQHSPTGNTVRISAKVVDQWIECKVEDRGPGFAKQELDRVFEPFFTKREGGTGLGLSIVQRIVEEHSGSIVAGNRADGGGVITILLPIAGPQKPRIPH